MSSLAGWLSGRTYRSLVMGVWLALLAALPFSSFSLMAKLLGVQSVSPASALGLFALVLAWLLPFLLRRGRLPWQSAPLLGFAAVALLSVLINLLEPAPAFREVPQWRGNLEGLLTLSIGICFFITAALLPRDEHSLAASLRFIHFGGVILIAWTLVQGFTWYTAHGYPDWMYALQRLIASNTLFTGRMSGTAYEPSWLAHVLNLCYLPLWLASTVRGYSAFRLRIWRLTVENMLLAGGSAALLLSASRVGVFAFLLMGALVLVFTSLKLIGWVEARIAAGPRRGWVSTPRRRRLTRAALVAAMTLLYALLLLGVAFAFSRFDERMAELFNFSVLRENSFIYYANKLVFADRVIYWATGWNIFDQHPILGVGLGSAGYYFPTMMPASGWGLSEVTRIMVEWSSIPNIKSLWVRLLAETGIAGFAFFMGWLFVMWIASTALRATRGRIFQTIGLAGAFVVVGLAVEGFSTDTFALPYFWVSFGLVIAASRAARCLPADRGFPSAVGMPPARKA